MFNILDFIFLNLAVTVTFTGILIHNFENYLPTFIIKGYRYGSFAYKGPDAKFLQVIEIPKAYYRHFYLFAAVFSVMTWFYMILVYYGGFNMHRSIPIILETLFWYNKPSVSAAASFIALSLLTVQCVRRFYETYYMQVFAKSSTMNLTHYLAGIIHYFGCVIAIIAEAPLFCGNTNDIKWSDMTTTLLAIPCILTFLWAFYEQYQTNLIFANLRKCKKTGKVITEEHKVPEGRLFEYISSPHRMCEVIMYSVLLMLIPTGSFFYIYLWVISNQLQTAVQAHGWYKKTFKAYPSNRKAIFPFLI